MQNLKQKVFLNLNIFIGNGIFTITMDFARRLRFLTQMLL